MQSGCISVFEINLLLKPGLQLQAPQGAAGDFDIDQESPLIDRLRTRGSTFITTISGVEESTLTVRKGSRFWRLVLLGAIGSLAYWTFFKGGLEQVKSWRDMLFGGGAVQTIIVEVAEPLPAPKAVILASQILENLSDSAAIKYLDVGGGLLLYRLSGEMGADQLAQLNATITGYRGGDIVPFHHNGQSGWGGAVAYHEEAGFERWNPPQSDYDRFFQYLRQTVTSGGGRVMLTAAGMLTPGEYVIGGDIALLMDHLTSIADGPRVAVYHRVSLLRQAEESGDQYQLRVVFNLVGGEEISPPASLPAGTGA